MRKSRRQWHRPKRRQWKQRPHILKKWWLKQLIQPTAGTEELPIYRLRLRKSEEIWWEILHFNSGKEPIPGQTERNAPAKPSKFTREDQMKPAFGLTEWETNSGEWKSTRLNSSHSQISYA